MNLTFIGGGNMAQAMIGGLRARPGRRQGKIVVVDPDPKARAKVARLGATALVGLNGLRGPLGDLVVLAVKPQAMQAACLSLARFLKDEPVLSIAAGMRLDALRRWLDGHPRLIRCMPNTPALVGAGVSGLYALPAVTAAQRKLAAAVLGAVGTVVWVEDEALLDPITAVSGSGPAYVFYFIEALRDAAVGMGLDARAANQLAIETFLGAAQLARQSGDDVSLLRERVTSKGGTTEAALRVLGDEQLAERFRKAVEAARRRSMELGATLGKDA